MDYDSKRSVDRDRILEQGKIVADKRLADIISEYADDFVGVLNDTRQFIMLNEQYFEGRTALGSMLGTRPGNILGCIHAGESEFGCGNAESCRFCGTTDTIIEAIKTRRKVTRDSRLLVERSGQDALNIRIKAVPLEFDEELFILLFIRDISAEIRNELMERAFFHDLLNSSVSLQSLVAVSDFSSDYIPDADRSIELSLTDIVEQIIYFQKLRKAENGELTVENSYVDLSEEIESVVMSVRNASFAEGRAIELRLGGIGHDVMTDRILYRRIVLNLLKNALEASKPGDTVTVRLETSGNDCIFSVSNPAVIPPGIRSQIFQRSFSTKGEGRGIGTYSVKMLGERYLGGKVDFSTGPGAGTVFRFRIPLYNN